MPRTKLSKAVKIKSYAAKHPDAKVVDIAKVLGVSYNYAYKILQKSKKPPVKVVPETLEEITKRIPTDTSPTHIVTAISGKSYEVPNFAPPPHRTTMVQRVRKFMKTMFD